MSPQRTVPETCVRCKTNPTTDAGVRLIIWLAHFCGTCVTAAERDRLEIEEEITTDLGDDSTKDVKAIEVEAISAALDEQKAARA